MKKVIIIFVFLSLINCQDGPRAVFNQEFVEVDRKKELPFENLVGVYNLDNDSKKRFGIEDSTTFFIRLEKDTTITAFPFINSTDRKVVFKEKKGDLFYINNFQSPPYSFYLDSKNEKWNNNINIYYRKKDKKLAIYIYIPPLQGQENGDYLRYIKVK